MSEAPPGRAVPRWAPATVLPVLAMLVAVSSSVALGVTPAAVMILALALGATASLGPRMVRDRAGPVLVAVAAFALTLSAADLALRRRIEEPVYRRYWPPMPDLSRFIPDAEMDRTIRGSLANMAERSDWAEPRRIAMRTDPWGFRNDPRPAGTPVTAIVLGDSYGVGEGTTQALTWSALLAARWGPGVYNLSMKGSPWHELMTLKVELARLHPAPRSLILWMLFAGNDLDEPYGPLDVSALRHNGRLKQLRRSAATLRNRSAIRQLLTVARRRARGDPAPMLNWIVPRPFPTGRPMLFFRPYVRNRALTAAQVMALPRADSLRETMRDMRRLADTSDLQVVVLVAPSKEQVYSWALDETTPWLVRDTTSGFATVTCRLASEAGIPCLDLTPDFVREAQRAYVATGEVLWWYDDTHWNNRGNAFAAERIMAWPLLAAHRGQP